MGGVVGMLMSNYGLELVFGENDIEFVRVKVGDCYVMEEFGWRDWYFGGEFFGYIVCLDKMIIGDGIVVVL